MACLRALVPLIPTSPPLQNHPHFHSYSQSKPSRSNGFHISAVIDTERPKEKLINQKNKSAPKEDSSVEINKQKDSISTLPPSPPVPRFPLNLTEIVAENAGSSLTETICNIGDGLITALLDPPSQKPSIDPKVQLSGNFAPVQEVPPRICPVVDGVLPMDLNGVYIRNGPNAASINSTTAGFHLFDGDGMLHAVSFKDGTATYCARYVKTNRYVQEASAGRPMAPRFFGGSFGVAGFARIGLSFARIALGLLDITGGNGLANTSVAYFDGKILAMSEDDTPYVVRITDEGDIETEGKWNFGDNLKFTMCAHPKFDQGTGEMFAFSMNPMLPPFSYFRVSADGVKSPDVVLPYTDVPLIHDFAITKKYAVFPDNQFVVRPLVLLQGEMPVVCDKNKVARLGIVPRYASPLEGATKMQWFEVPECNSFHYMNAWDEGDDVVIITSILSPPELFLNIPAYDLDCTLTEVRLNTRTGMVSKRKICSGCFEFGTFDYRRTGRRSKFVYMSSGRYPEMTAVVKIDVSTTQSEKAIVGKREFGPSCYGSEPFFVPRTPRGTGTGTGTGEDEDEDYGYLVAFVYNEMKQSSDMVVMDASTPSLDVVAKVKLPSRVPYGFHGCFVNQDQLSQQR